MGSSRPPPAFRGRSAEPAEDFSSGSIRRGGGAAAFLQSPWRLRPLHEEIPRLPRLPPSPAAPARGSSRPRGADARGTAGRGRSGKLSTIPCGQNKAASVEAGISKFPFPQQRGVTSGAVAHRHGQAGPRCSGTENSLEKGGLEQSWLDPPREHGQEPSQEPSRHLQRRWRRRRRGRDVPGTRQALRGSREPRGPTAPSASATEGAE